MTTARWHRLGQALLALAWAPGAALAQTTPPAPATPATTAATASTAPTLRTWTPQRGAAVQATLERVSGSMVILRGADGQRLMFGLDSLSPTDQQYVRTQAASGAAPTSTGAGVSRTSGSSTTAPTAPAPARPSAAAPARPPAPATARPTAPTGQRPSAAATPAPEQMLVLEHDDEIILLPPGYGGANGPGTAAAVAQAQAAAAAPINFNELPTGTLKFKVGQPAPSLGVMAYRSEEIVRLQELKGRVVLILFWSPNSELCVEMVPRWVEVYQKYRSRGFEIMGVVVNSTFPGLMKFGREHGIEWPQTVDTRRATYDQWGVTNVPWMVLIDQSGNIAYDNLSINNFEAGIRRLMRLPSEGAAKP